MHAKDLLIDKSSHWQAIEAVTKHLPEADIKPPLALVIEPIYTIDGGTLMVASEKKEVLLVFYLVCKKKANCLYALLTTVYIVPQKQIVCLRW